VDPSKNCTVPVRGAGPDAVIRAVKVIGCATVGDDKLVFRLTLAVLDAAAVTLTGRVPELEVVLASPE